MRKPLRYQDVDAAAGESMGKAYEGVGFQPDPFQQLYRPIPGGGPFAAPWTLKRLRQYLFDAMPGVQRMIRILENDLEIFSIFRPRRRASHIDGFIRS